MNEEQTSVCPWCQTEITWDEELGPEEQCPHCLNELTDYRSVPLLDSEDEDEELESLGAGAAIGAKAGIQASPTDDNEDELYTMNGYEAITGHLVSRQDVFADCGICGQEMLHVGKIAAGHIEQPSPAVAMLAQPLLNGKLDMDAFVCPSCFRVEMKLTDEARIQFVQQLLEHGEDDK